MLATRLNPNPVCVFSFLFIQILHILKNFFLCKVVRDKAFVSFFFSRTKRYPVTVKTSSESLKVSGAGETGVLGSKIQWM